MNLLRRIGRALGASTAGDGPHDAGDNDLGLDVAVDYAALDDDRDAFVCSNCGRTDLPPAGDWDPPICEECDAAINFDPIREQESPWDR